MSRLKNIFGKDHNIAIGAVHFPPLPGYSGFPGMKKAERNALYDLRAFKSGGMNGIIFENNYDQPHTTEAGPGTVAAMACLGEEINKNSARMPVGVSTLWNDFKTSLDLAKLLGLSFIRVPVFVDTVRAPSGLIRGNPKEVVAYRKKLHAEKVALFTDIHVKHARLLSKFSLVQSARLAIKSGSDALILTGKWTGDAPDMASLREVRKAVGNFPIIIGSGASERNARELLRYANGVIVSTSLKRGSAKRGEENVKAYNQRIVEKKVKRFISAIRG